MSSPIPTFPAQGSTSWYSYATVLDSEARKIATKSDVGHSHVLGDLAALIATMIVETSTGVWSNTVPVRTVGQYPCLFVSGTDPKDATNGVPGKANINIGDAWIPTT